MTNKERYEFDREMQIAHLTLEYWVIINNSSADERSERRADQIEMDLENTYRDPDLLMERAALFDRWTTAAPEGILSWN